MPAPSPPTGYDEAHHVLAGHPDRHITVGFDRHQRHIPRFLVQLHYRVSTDPIRWEAIARMDHNETSNTGHDVYREGLHVDIKRRSGGPVHLQLRHAPLPTSRGVVLSACNEYLRREADYFIDVYEGRRRPGGPPRWAPDGGRAQPLPPPPTLIRESLLSEGMSQESPVEDALTPTELSEVLAEAEGTTAGAIERGAEALEIAPPDEAAVVDE